MIEAAVPLIFPFPSTTVQSVFRIIRLWFFVFLATLEGVHAHPVAQGTIELNIQHERAEGQFRISNEQIFVASTFGKKAAAQAPAKSLEQLWQEHAAYLLEHVTLMVNGRPIPGELVTVTPPRDHSIKGFTQYDVRFAFPTPSPPSITLSENLLNEIEFAPGNPWEATFAVRVRQEGQILEEARLLSAKQPLEIRCSWNLSDQFGQTTTSTGLGRLAGDFFFHGLHHIAASWDHVLFVAALVLAVARLWRVIALVTAFSVAHTITLTLAVLRIAYLPREWVEPMIAISIIVGAALNFFPNPSGRLSPRLVVAFGFGLFHGLGFAGGLIQAMEGFSSSAIAASVAAFSVGVEAGHQIVVIPLVLVMAGFRSFAPRSVSWTVRIGSGLIAAAGCFLLIVTLR